MAEITVGKLAESVGISVERLLQQMAEAGLSQTKDTDTVDDEEKKKLLVFLKNSHGEATPAAETKKITLKRKTLSTLKAPSTSGKKTVNVEVRKKRTYVKKDEADIQAQKDLEEAQKKEEQAMQEQELAELKRQQEEARLEEEAKRIAEESKSAEAPRSSSFDDIELKRQAAAQARKEEEEKQKLAIQAIQERKAAEAELKKDREEQAKKRSEKAKTVAAKPGFKTSVKKPSSEEGEEEKTKRKKGRGPKTKENKSNKLNIYSMLDDEDDLDMGRSLSSDKRPGVELKFNNKHTFQKPVEAKKNVVELPPMIQVSELAQQMAVKSGEVIKALMKMGTMATLNESIDQDTAQLLLEEMGFEFKLVSDNQLEEQLEEVVKSVEGTMQNRAPVVTVMGHVDHGKTSLLDYIRNSRVASGEAGGITQHIGAYSVDTDHGKITFLDTPGHAAFTAMRARGAQSTDVVILVVAADDGVMPQTEEAVQHSKAAGVPIVVAVNKIDKEDADPEKVKNELSALEVIPEEWGGDVQFVPVSAHTGEGIEKLLESVLLQSEMLELQAAEDIPATGVVVESRLDKGRGTVATVLVQNGTLRKGDIVLAGTNFGRVRAMISDQGQDVVEAGPSVPVELLGLDEAPNAGDEFLVLPDERKAREVAEHRQHLAREERQTRQQRANLENMFASFGEDEKKTLPVFVKADVRGSLEAILSSLAELGNEEVEVQIVGSGVGGLTESDINLALTSNAIVIGFNVRADATAKKTAEQESLEIRYYSVIYNLLDDVKQGLSGMLAPERVESIVGIAEVRDVFRSPKFGQVAGCMVVEGAVFRNKPIRVLRDNVVIHEGELDSLRRFKDDVAEVRNGIECGIGVKDYDVKVGDQIEVFDIQEIARSL